MKLSEALPIATRIVELLKQDCYKIDIAGSVRRQMPEVKDIEIVCLPHNQVEKDMFGEVTSRTRSRRFVLNATNLGESLKGSVIDGRYKRIALKEGIVLDLFMPQPADYYRQLAIRTGSAWYAKDVLAASWRKNGWCGTDQGLRKMVDCEAVKTADLKPKWVLKNPHGLKPPAWGSEEDFFTWLGLKWVDPKNRI